MTFSYSANTNNSQGGWFSVVGRSDDRIFVPKADCAFNPNHNYWPNSRVCPGGKSETVSGIWRAPYSALPLVRHLPWLSTVAGFPIAAFCTDYADGYMSIVACDAGQVAEVRLVCALVSLRCFRWEHAL